MKQWKYVQGTAQWLWKGLTMGDMMSDGGFYSRIFSLKRGKGILGIRNIEHAKLKEISSWEGVRCGSVSTEQKVWLRNSGSQTD